MKKIFIMAILAVAFVGCGESLAEKEERVKLRATQKERHINEIVEDYSVVVIDSCEYVILSTNDEGYMAHKGNCIYCEKR